MNTHALLLATDAIFDLRQYVTLLGLRNPAIRRQMNDLESRMLAVEELVGSVADGARPEFGLLNEVRGLFVPVARQ